MFVSPQWSCRLLNRLDRMLVKDPLFSFIGLLLFQIFNRYCERACGDCGAALGRFATCAQAGFKLYPALDQALPALVIWYQHGRVR